MENLLHNLFQFQKPVSVGTKIQLRAFELFTVIYANIYAWEWALYIPRLSDLMLPLGLAEYINVEFFYVDHRASIVAALITLSTVLPFLVKRFRWGYAVAFLLFHLQYVIRFSQGEIPHSSNLVGFSLLGLALGGVFIRDIRKSLPFAFGFLLFFTGLGYTSAALSKLVASGIAWPEGTHLWLWIAEKKIDILSKTGSFELNWLQQLALSNRFIATVILLVGLLTELSGFLIWWRRYRSIIITAILAMHVGIDLTMNILFLSFMIELVIVGYPWNRWINRLAGEKDYRPNNLFLGWLLY